MLIFKIMTLVEWETFKTTSVFLGSEVDLSDGFIHFSTKEQTIETANKHFTGQKNLVLVAINESTLAEKLIYEPSRGGQLFPHLYAPLPFSAVNGSATFNPSKEGTFHFPSGFTK